MTRQSFFAQVGSRVVISGQEHGVLRYLGPVHFQVCSLSVLLGENAMFFTRTIFQMDIKFPSNYHLNSRLAPGAESSWTVSLEDTREGLGAPTTFTAGAPHNQHLINIELY